MWIFISGIYGTKRRPEPCERFSEESGQAAYGNGKGDPWGGVKKDNIKGNLKEEQDGSAICTKERGRSGSASMRVRRRTLPLKRYFPICSSRNAGGRRMTGSGRMSKQAGCALRA